jgi:predicted GIY-YIG superfamily endonuclease
MSRFYVLKLESGKYYVGKTHNLELRFQEHKSGNGSEWTKKYKPISIMESYNHHSTFEEDVLTKQYMMKYGIDNVRGGSYTKIELEDWQIKSLEHEFKSVSDKCFKCGETGHFANECIDKPSYSDKFNTEEELTAEIDRLTELRLNLTIDINNINDVKYVSFIDNLNTKTIIIEGSIKVKTRTYNKIEIEPSIIEKYNMRTINPRKAVSYISDEPNGHNIYYQLQNRCGLFDKLNLNWENVVENIHKIYIYRKKLERKLSENLKDVGIDIDDFTDLVLMKENIEKELNKKIEQLLVKLAEII